MGAQTYQADCIQVAHRLQQSLALPNYELKFPQLLVISRYGWWDVDLVVMFFFKADPYEKGDKADA